MTKQPVSIIVADDHDLFRQGLMALLGRRRSITIIGEAQDGQQAFELIQQQQPDVAIVDVSMPKMTGLQVCEQLQKIAHTTRVVILTMHDDILLANEAIRCGANAYVLKDNTFDEVLDAIHSVMNDEVYISPVVAKYQTEAAGNAVLTERETDVLTLIAKGYKVREIADLLAISTKSIDTYRMRLMKKLGVKNSAQLIQYATRRGLV